MADEKEHYSFFGQELQSELKRMVSESLQKSSYNLFRSFNLAKAIMSQRPGRRPGAMELAKLWARFNLEASNIINRHSQQAVNEIIDSIEQYGFFEPPSKKSGGTRTQRGPGPKVEIEVHARKGEKATAPFIVANSGGEAMEATFTVTDFISEEGHRVSSEGIRFVPDVLRLLPGQEATVQIEFAIGRAFRVDTMYSAKIMMPGHLNREFILKLHVARSVRTKTAAARTGRASAKGRKSR